MSREATVSILLGVVSGVNHGSAMKWQSAIAARAIDWWVPFRSAQSPVTATCCECETFCPHLTAGWARLHSRRAPVPRSTVRTSTPDRCREPAAHRLRFPRSIPVCDSATSTATAASITAAGPGPHLVPMHRPNTSQIADPDRRLKHGRSNRAGAMTLMSRFAAGIRGYRILAGLNGPFRRPGRRTTANELPTRNPSVPSWVPVIREDGG
jgi:hypothetical protein